MLHKEHRSQLKGKLSDDDGLLSDALKRKFKGIAHFAYSDREGLYDCKENNEGFNVLGNLIVKKLKVSS